MLYKTVLVHVDESNNIDSRVELAASLAKAAGGHLIGTAFTGVSHFFYESIASGAADPVVLPHLEVFHQKAQHALERFEETVTRLGVASYEKRLVDDEAAGGLALQAHYSDLVVLGQFDPASPTSSTYIDVPEYVITHSGCPSLVIPYAGEFPDLAERVLIAWNESMESLHAVRNALPLLRTARQVDLVVFESETEKENFGEQPGAEIALYLARHDVKVNVIQEKTPLDVGNALLSLAADLDSTLLVMGCYGHARFREVLLGGVTRTVLQSMTLPVLLSH